MDCPTCGANNPAEADWCGQCHGAFAPPPPSADDVALDEFRRRKRAEAVPVFGRTASVTLRPARIGGVLLYREPGGDYRAKVVSVGDTHACVDLDGNDIFSVERYEAVDQKAYSVFDPSHTPLAVYLSDGEIFRREIEVRDGTGAPVAVMRPARERWDIMERNGAHVGFCFRQDIILGEYIDDEWGLSMFEEPRLLDRRALIAAPLVCRLLMSRRPRPNPAARPKASTGALGIPALDIFAGFAGLFF